MTTALRDAATTFVGVPARAQTYRNLTYLGLAFPLGLAYFVALTVGLSLGVSLAITLLGVPILLATLAGATLLASFEVELANRLLGTDVRTRSPDGSDGVLDAAKRLVTSAQTWLDAGYLLVKFGFGLVSFTALVSLLSVSGSLLVAPLTYSSAYYVGPHFGNLSVGPFESGRFVVDAFGEAVVVAVAGLVLTLVSLHLLNALARVWEAVVEAMLDTPDENDGSTGGSDGAAGAAGGVTDAT